MTDNEKSRQAAKSIADYVLAGQKVPEELKRNLIKELCEEYRQERQGRGISNSKKPVA